jgi:regulator of cell morphogenesis and NO signaling
MTETFAGFYAGDHDRLDDVFKQYRALKMTDAQAQAHARFQEFKIGLERHIGWEEGLLFPLFEAKTGMHNVGPTIVMRREHQQIRSCLNGIHATLAAGELPPAQQDNDLLAILESHNLKEESILYPMIDRQSTAAEREQVFLRMDGTVQKPEAGKA